jgi:3-deoxy-D-manno-octulosonic-acid transferase
MIPLPFASVAVAEGRPVPPGLCSPEVLTAAIHQQQARAELAVSPGARILGGIAALAGSAACPAASLVLRTRTFTERKERMGRITRRHDRPVWLHGASLGELKGLLAVTERLRELDIPFFVTAVSPAGRDFIERNGFHGSYLPLDIPSSVNRFLDRLCPRALVLAETEFWPILLRETAIRGIPAALINGRLSKGSLRGYRLIAPLFTGILRCFRILLTRTAGDTERFGELGLPAVTAGDGK